MKAIDNPRLSMDDSGNLYFSNVTMGDATTEYVYTCASYSKILMKHSFGDSVNLQVTPVSFGSVQNRVAPMAQYTSPSNSIVARGKKTELFCIFGGTPMPYTVWLKNDKIVPWSERIMTRNNGRSIVIHRAKLEDQGEYKCNVTNGVGEPQPHTIKLSVKSTPYFHYDPVSQEVSNGGSIEVFCDARGDPKPFIKWTFNGKLLNKARPDPRRVIKQNKLLISNSDHTFAGNYGCNATNSYGYIYKDFYISVV